MKQAFTTLELIFVIVILGILAVIVIPKLSATRDDAEVSKSAMNVAILISDVASYYTAKGNFAPINEMSTVYLDSNNRMKIKNIECIQFSVGDATASDADQSKGIDIGSPIIKIIPINSTNSVCINTQKAIKKITDSSPINVGQGSVKF